LSAESNQNQEQQPEVKQTDTREYNFAQIRKQLEAERAEKQKMSERLSELEKHANSNRNADSDEDEVSDEPYVDERRLNKKLAKFEQRFEKKVQDTAEQRARALLEQERQNIFLKQNPDFGNVLTPDIVQKFADKYPDIAEPMLELPDNFARQKLLYQNIKALGLHKKEEERQPIQQKVEQNRRSPYYHPTGISTPPHSATGDFSQTGQKNAYDKMKELQRNLRI
jgi:hypothetical protein